MQARHKATIRLLIRAVPTVRQETVYLYVNGEDGANEEILCLEISYYRGPEL